MTEKDLPDAPVRKRIATEFGKSFFVEAGAGSGKTHSLVDRMAGLIRCGHAKVENIAAVTFTRKAAAELRERFQIELEANLHEKGASTKEKERIDEALSEFERTSISTIHSFCAKLLRERPVEAGIDPGFEEIEEQEDNIFAEQVWNEYVERQGFEGNKCIGWMRDNGVEPDWLKDIYLTLVRYPDVEVAREDVPKPDFREEKKAVKKTVQSLGKMLPESAPPGGWDKLQTTIRKALKLIHLGYLDEDRLFITLLDILKKESGVTQNRWTDKTWEKCSEEMEEFRKNIVFSALNRWKEYLHKPLIEFAMNAADYYETWRMERSILNFQDLLMKTARLLKGSPEVRAYFKRRITHLLVDEFQDTDPIQAEIIILLTGEDDSESDWRKVIPKTGSLFLVGDPKQSIYRFRRADIDIYNQVKTIFAGNTGEVLELTSNFRSLNPIGSLTDTVFISIFPEDDTQYQAKFALLRTIRKASDGFDNGILENRIARIKGNYAKVIAQNDAQTIAVWIQQSINGGLKLQRTEDEKRAGATERAMPGDFMIITKRKDKLPLYARALETLGIPYEISGGEGFGESEELREIYKVLKAVADTMNPVALLAALRGYFFGISDNDLYHFSKAGGKFSYFSPAEKGPEIIKQAFTRLKEFHEIALKNTPFTAIEIIIERLGAIPLAVSQKMGSTKAGNILKVMDLLLTGSRTHKIGGFPESVDYLKDLLDAKAIEEMSLFPCTTKAVRLMNLHKAKGLEALVVILTDPTGALGDHEPLFHIKRTGDKSLGYFTITKPTGEYHSDCIASPGNWEEHAGEEKSYEDEEKKRHDYVAVTRAKNILVVSTYHEGEKLKAWQSLFPYLDTSPKLKVAGSGNREEKQTLKIKPTDWTRYTDEITDNLRKTCTKSYDALSVTETIEKSGIFGETTGEGTVWGSIVHKALEICGRGDHKKLETLAPPQTDLIRLTKLVDEVMKSALWQRQLKAEEKYFEIPFSILKDNTIYSGIIDLIFRETDGWVIVDYKTDDFEKDPQRKSAYENQLATYSKLWQEISGDRVKEQTLLKV